MDRQLSGRQSAINPLLPNFQADDGQGGEGGQSSESRKVMQRWQGEAQQAQKALAEELEETCRGTEVRAGAGKACGRTGKGGQRIAAMLRKPKQEVVERQDRFRQGCFRRHSL